MAAGKKTGGRQRGTPNRATAAKAAEIAASGLTPLDFMLSVLRNPEQSQEVRLDAAAKAAPYVHPRLAQVETKGEVTVKKEVSPDPVTPELWEKTYGQPTAH